MYSLAVFGYSLLLRCSASNIQDAEDTERKRENQLLSSPCSLCLSRKCSSPRLGGVGAFILCGERG